MKKVVLVSKAQFEMGASYRRVEQLAKLFKSAGFEVAAYCISGSSAGTVLERKDGITMKSVWKKPSGFKNKFLTWMFEKTLFLKAIRLEKPDAICAYSTMSFSAAYNVRRFCQRNQIPLYWDVVEKRKPFQSFRIKSMLEYNIPNYLINSVVIKAPTRVIAVSKHLVNFFERKGIKTFYLPITMTVPDTEPVRPHGDKIHFLYSGIPFGRDLIFEILKAFLDLPDDILARISLTICGSGTDKLAFSSAGIDERSVCKLKTFTNFLGQISLDQMQQVLAETNFSLLLKDEKKIYSKAGFPTKISEALANGIVPICNISGDLGEFLEDGLNSYICSGHDCKSMSEQIVRACREFESKYSFLSVNAYKTAASRLNIKTFELGFSKFVRGDN